MTASPAPGPDGVTPEAESWPESPTARWWTPLDDGRIQCDLCPRRCRLHAGQRGFCFVRARDGDRMVLTTYGRSSGFAIDPVEKKPLAHFYPGTAVLSFGTAGCNLNCRFCQNWDISKSREWDRLTSVASPEAIAEAASASRCDSIAFTYNDPVIFAEYAIDTALACHERGIHTIAVTAGYISPEARDEFFAPMDAANIDLKAFTEEFYWKVTGGHLRDVLDTIVWVHEHTDTWMELTTLLIPGHNDSNEEIARMSKWILTELGPDVPLHFSAFHPDFKMLDVPPTPRATLRAARATALDSGLHFVYTGNMHDPGGETTSCYA
ncbi:MAG: AmmeMemoRadiSam system radical SAM enzyme, partial [Actinobacteria bacterium HGW-Actinobacteria-8]